MDIPVDGALKVLTVPGESRFFGNALGPNIIGGSSAGPGRIPANVAVRLGESLLVETAF